DQPHFEDLAWGEAREIGGDHQNARSRIHEYVATRAFLKPDLFRVRLIQEAERFKHLVSIALDAEKRLTHIGEFVAALTLLYAEPDGDDEQTGGSERGSPGPTAALEADGRQDSMFEFFRRRRFGGGGHQQSIQGQGVPEARAARGAVTAEVRF